MCAAQTCCTGTSRARRHLLGASPSATAAPSVPRTIGQARDSPRLEASDDALGPATSTTCGLSRVRCRATRDRGPGCSSGTTTAEFMATQAPPCAHSSLHHSSSSTSVLLSRDARLRVPDGASSMDGAAERTHCQVRELRLLLGAQKSLRPVATGPTARGTAFQAMPPSRVSRHVRSERWQQFCGRCSYEEHPTSLVHRPGARFSG